MTEAKRGPGRPRKVAADPAPGDNGKALAAIVAFYQAEFPEQWETLRLCPLQHGLDTMVEALKD